MQDKDDLINDEYDTSEDENITEIETFEHYGEKIHETEETIPTETSQVLTVFNKTIHHEDDLSDDKSVIEIEPPKENGEQQIGKQDKLLTTKFQIERLILEITKNCGELMDHSPNYALHFICITFHLYNISFALHLKNLPRQHEMPAMSHFKCHALHLHFMKYNQ